MNSGDGAPSAATPSWWRTAAHRPPAGTHARRVRARAGRGRGRRGYDVRLTRDGHLVCVHDRTVDRTSNGTGVVSEMTLAEFAELDYGHGRRAGCTSERHRALIALTLDWSARPVKLFIETKHPVRYGGLVESKVLALPHRFGIAAPPSADHSRAVVMSFSAGAVWRIRRSAPMLPTVLLGDPRGTSAGSRDHRRRHRGRSVGEDAARTPGLVDKAAAAGRAPYCWTVDHRSDVELPRTRGRWVATNHPGRTKNGCRTASPAPAATSGSPLRVEHILRNGRVRLRAPRTTGRRRRSSHTTTEPESLPVNSPIGTVVVVMSPRSAHASRARSHMCAPESTVSESAAALRHRVPAQAG